MKTEQQFKTTIKEVPNKSGTKHIYIPKSIIDMLKLQKGDEIIVSIKRSEIIELLCNCLDCGEQSISSSNDIYCKYCGSEDMEIISEDIEKIVNWKNQLEK